MVNLAQTMYWADQFAQKIIKSAKHRPFWADDMKTPSGRIHVGSLRGVITHNLIYQSLLDAGQKATFSYIIDDHDPMDGLPVYLDQKKYQKYLGQPLNTVPSPQPGFKSYAHYFAQDFIEVFNACGCQPKIIWASQLYQTGKMNQGIKKCLNQADKIRKIYKKVAHSFKPQDWYPFQVICEKCGKVGTTKVTAWDGQKVTYSCLPDLVDWAKGCGHQGKISPLNGTGKLPWKIEWAVKWQAVGITIEGAGKDHMTEGGSHDIAAAICKKIINYPLPFAFSHEFFLVGGKKMSSSKGRGTSARDMFNLLPPQILRFLIARPKYNQAIDFDPGGLTIPDLFDDYDACAAEFFQKKGKSRLGRIWQLSQVKPLPPEKPFFPRFRDLANYLQLSQDLPQKFAQIKGCPLTKTEKEILKERIKYAQIWLKNYAPKNLVYQVSLKPPPQAKKLTPPQKKYLKALLQLIKQKKWSPEDLQTELYNLTKAQKIPASKAFQAVYLALTGKDHGPKAAWFLLDQNQPFLIKRLTQVTAK